MARNAARADWFKLESIELGNSGFGGDGGDEVGVATPWSFPKRNPSDDCANAEMGYAASSFSAWSISCRHSRNSCSALCRRRT